MKREDVRQVQEVNPRVETGPIRFGDDWSGAFIRGDDAFHFTMSLRRALDCMTPQAAEDQLAKTSIEHLASILESSNEQNP